jgi:large-conductance mechanosensitive channel
MEVAELTDELKSDREHLFSSVKFPVGQSLKNQLSNAGNSSAYKLGFLIGKLLGYLTIVGVIVLIIVLVSRRTRNRERSAAKNKDEGTNTDVDMLK